MAKRKRIGGSNSAGAKTQEYAAEGSTDVHEKKRRKRSTSPNTDPVSKKIASRRFFVVVLTCTQGYEQEQETPKKFKFMSFSHGY